MLNGALVIEIVSDSFCENMDGQSKKNFGRLKLETF